MPAAVLPHRPTSPTFSQTTDASAANFQGGPERIITKKDLRASLSAYEDLITASRTYRSALVTVSHASAGFASAIDKCARLKGVSDESGAGFLAAGGLNYLIANHEQVLGDAFLKTFELPLSQQLQAYRTKVTERSIAYERAQVELSKKIRQTEAENIRVGRRKQRDLQSFRTALARLQAQVDDLDRVKADYYNEVLEAEEETWDFVLSKVSHVVRSSLDVYERIAAKATDPALEPMLSAIPDPFDSYGPAQGEDKIFSILTPLGVMTPNTGGSTFANEEAGTRTPTGLDKVRNWMDIGDAMSSPGLEAGDQPVPVANPSEVRRRTILPAIEELNAAEDAADPVEPSNVPLPEDPRTEEDEGSRTPMRESFMPLDPPTGTPGHQPVEDGSYFPSVAHEGDEEEEPVTPRKPPEVT